MAEEEIPSPPSDAALSDDIYRRVLQSPSLDLGDVAQLAPTCQLFREAYLEARAVEEAWLEEQKSASEAMFGACVVDAVCEWLFFEFRQERRSPDEPRRGLIEMDITAEATQPQPAGKLDVTGWQFVRLTAPVWGLRGDGGESKVSWELEDHGYVKLAVFRGGPSEIVIVYSRGEGRNFFLMTDWPTALLPICCGFLHRILEEEALLPDAHARHRRRPHMEINFRLVSKLLRDSSKAAVGGLQGQLGGVLRAVSALKMRHWPRWSIGPLQVSPA